MNHTKGDILRGRRGSDAIHPIIFLEGHDDSFFIGAMITHSPRYAGNILMLKEHFNEFDGENKKFKLYFNNTHLVEAKLLKRMDWRPFVKVGELSASGITFVETRLKGLYPEVWEDYLNS